LDGCPGAIVLTLDVWPRLVELGKRLPEWLPVANFASSRRLTQREDEVVIGVAGLNEPDLTAAKRACGILIVAGCFVALPPVAMVLAVVPLYYAASWLPELAVKAAEEKTRRSIDEELPRLAELMAVMTTAGLSPALALPRAVGDCVGPLRRSLDKALAAINLGVPRRQALAQAAAWTPSRDYVRFAELLADAERFGQPLGAALRGMAVDLREKQAAAVREEAQKLPIKMLFPLVFLILPAFILLSAGPLILNMVG